ncbi:hypothetical protein [uncultured Croceitalea sp.]|uniref:hypothetical protein n=1 Tax=uncultured Croceitalea sp. TaxID=1798908 RepID=UPI003305E34E
MVLLAYSSESVEININMYYLIIGHINLALAFLILSALILFGFYSISKHRDKK